MIYVSHAYGENENNKTEIESIVRELVKRHPGVTYVSPVHAFGFLYSDVDYIEGMNYCLELLDYCTAMMAFGPVSKGVRIEMDSCNKRGIPFIHIEDVKEWLKAGR